MSQQFSVVSLRLTPEEITKLDSAVEILRFKDPRMSRNTAVREALAAFFKQVGVVCALPPKEPSP